MDSPYREPKPLTDLIPPDRRRQRTAVLVVTSMLAGAAVFQLAQWGLQERDSKAMTPPLVEPTTMTNTAPIERSPRQDADGLVTSAAPLSAEEVQSVVAAHRVELKRRCWDQQDVPSKVASAKVTLYLIVGAHGNVVSASATGTDALIASCVEDRARSWTFPAHAERSATIQIPFVFARD